MEGGRGEEILRDPSLAVAANVGGELATPGISHSLQLLEYEKCVNPFAQLTILKQQRALNHTPLVITHVGKCKLSNEHFN